MNGEHVGQWRVGRGQHLFTYDPSWLQSPHARPLSLSMPLGPAGQPYGAETVQAYFENLLPDNDDIRRRIMTRFGVSSTSAFDLLEEIGRDCVGAVQLLRPQDPPPDVEQIRGHPVREEEVGALLERVRSPNMGAQDEDDFRLSLAGAQEKTALLWHQGGWWVPEGPTPTTHIFKLPMTSRNADLDLSTSVENEWLCSEILRRFEVPCARSEIKIFGQQKVLVVERFDRRVAPSGSWIMRIPQDDLCQATGSPPGKKYERDGGPGIRRILDLLLGSMDAQKDREDFFRTQFLFWLLCAIDGHAKNFSVSIHEVGRFRLTPRYDVVSAYPFLGEGPRRISPHKVKMAMSVLGQNRHYRWNEVHVTHWLETARLCGLEASGQGIIEAVLARTPEVVSKLRDSLPPEIPPTVSEPILQGLLQTAQSAQNALTAF